MRIFGRISCDTKVENRAGSAKWGEKSVGFSWFEIRKLSFGVHFFSRKNFHSLA